MSDIELHRPTHDTSKKYNGWCGPGALSILLGITAEDANDWIVHLNKMAKSYVKGTHTHEVAVVLRHFGLRADLPKYKGSINVTTGRYESPTFNQWLNQAGRGKRTFLVSAGHHWIVVQGNRIADNQQGLMTADTTKHKRKRVDFTVEITGRVKKGLKLPDRKVKPRAKWKPSKEYLWIKRWCAERGYRVKDIVDTRRAARGEWTEVDIPSGWRYEGCTCYHVESLKEVCDVLASLERATPDQIEDDRLWNQ